MTYLPITPDTLVVNVDRTSGDGESLHRQKRLEEIVTALELDAIESAWLTEELAAFGSAVFQPNNDSETVYAVEVS